MGHLDVSRVSFALPDGTLLLDDVSFRVPAGGVVALVGANGAGKSTLLRLIAGEIPLQTGTVTTSGTIGVMPQFIGSVRDRSVVRDLLLAAAPQRLRDAAAAVDAAELALMEADDEPLQMRYAQALSDWADAGGYDLEVLWDTVTVAALNESYELAKWRDVSSLSGGEQKRLVLEALLRGPDSVLLLDEPDNYLDVHGKTWLEDALRESPKTVLFISLDRELLRGRPPPWSPSSSAPQGIRRGPTPEGRHLPRRPSRAVRTARRASAPLGRGTREAQGAGPDVQDKGGLQRRARQSIPGGEDAPEEIRGSRAAPSHRAKAAGDDALEGWAHRKTRGRLPESELTGLMRRFDAEIWFGERVAVLGANGSGKSHFLRLLAAGGTDPEREHRPVGEVEKARSPIAARRNSALVYVQAGSPKHTSTLGFWGAPCLTFFIAATNTATGCHARRPAACSTGTNSPARPSRHSRPFRADNRRGCRSCCSNYLAPPCFCSISRRTTSTLRVRRLSRRAWRHTRGQSSL